MVQKDFFTKLTEHHPFITVCSYADQDYVGIVQNRDDTVTTIYDYGAIINLEATWRYLFSKKSTVLAPMLCPSKTGSIK